VAWPKISGLLWCPNGPIRHNGRRRTKQNRQLDLQISLPVQEVNTVSQIYDITRSISEELAEWPGDAPFSMGWSLHQSRGDVTNVGWVTMSTHFGSHIDAPYHFDTLRNTIDEVPLELFMGPARLIDVRGRAVIGRDDLGVPDEWMGTPRLLLRTGAWDDSTRYPASIPVLAEDVPEFLAAHQVRLVGIDVPSVDELSSTTLPIHHALAARQIHILEGLDLRLPPAGMYELIALPLKIRGADASPVRAILRTWT
jgi:arylformamidase